MNENPNAAAGQSHKALILAHLQTGAGITQMEALTKYRCMRLGARIKDLRDSGHPEIQSRMITTGTGKKVAEYYLPA